MRALARLPLHTAALAFVSFGIVLVQVQLITDGFDDDETTLDFPTTLDGVSPQGTTPVSPAPSEAAARVGVCLCRTCP